MKLLPLYIVRIANFLDIHPGHLLTKTINHNQLTCLVAGLVHTLASHSHDHQGVSMQWQEAGKVAHA